MEQVLRSIAAQTAVVLTLRTPPRSLQLYQSDSRALMWRRALRLGAVPAAGCQQSCLSIRPQTRAVSTHDVRAGRLSFYLDRPGAGARFASVTGAVRRPRNPISEFALIDKDTGVEYYKVNRIEGDGKCMFRATVRPCCMP